MVEKTRVGPFEILGRLGSNRRHRVFRARQVEQQRDVALKFIRLPPDVDRERALALIQSEVEILKRLRHPNLVRVFGAGVAEDQIFFACELIEGESLSKVLARRDKLAPDLAVDIARQIAAALGYLHENEIVHGKLTPDKILIDHDNHVYVTDVRLNRAKRRSWDATHRREIDTAAYMAPEQFNEGTNEKSDLYALGAILYEMLTGRIHLEPETLARVYQQKMNATPPSVGSIVLDCPIWLDRLVASLLDAKEANRPHSALAVYYALEEIRKVDKNRTAVVDQMTSGFNPLTAGADKTEAQQLLGKIPKPDDRVPLLQRGSLQVVVLALIVCLIVYGVWPVSSQKLYNRGMELMQSNDLTTLIKAQDLFNRIVDRGEGSPLHVTAEQKLFETRGKVLLIRAETGYSGIEPFTKRFADAYLTEQGGNYELAKLQYEKLVQTLSEDGPFRHIVWESKKRIEKLDEWIQRRERSKAAENGKDNETAAEQPGENRVGDQ